MRSSFVASMVGLVALVLACMVGAASAAPSFAVYLASMDTANSVLIFSGASNGMLTSAGSILTQGTGAPVAGVQSQNALAVVGNYLFVCNPGSNQVSQFSISTTDPTQLSFVAIATTAGDYPNSVTGHSASNIICVSLSGALNPGVQCFAYTSTGMTAVASSQRTFNDSLTTPPVSHTGPSQVAFTPDGTGLWVVDKTPPTQYSPPYSYYTVALGSGGSAVSLAAARATSAAIGAVNFAGAFDTDAAFVTVDAGLGVNVLTYSSSSGVSAAGFTSVSPSVAACWITRGTNLAHFFTVNAGSATATEVSRSGSTVSIVRQISIYSSGTDVIVVPVGTQDYLIANTGPAMMLRTMTVSSSGATSYQNVTATTTAGKAAGLAYYVTPHKSAAAAGTVPTLAATAALIVMCALAHFA